MIYDIPEIIYPFIHLFISLFIHSFIHSFIHCHSFIHFCHHVLMEWDVVCEDEFIHSFIHLFIHSFNNSFIHFFIHTIIHSIIHSFNHSFIQSRCRSWQDFDIFFRTYSYYAIIFFVFWTLTVKPEVLEVHGRSGLILLMIQLALI
jgi:hypothetical protein